MATPLVYDIARFVWTAAESPLRQQWPISFGTIFAYATASLLAAAIEAAYDQQLWTLSK
ncbi:uncharacterized protein Bfra_002776sb [Botrytis fragariae]|uniref:Uncharacterized protein n=1 Tax=Botrytis fragariae TaxID=1964551 RepID=A0A8H6AZI8_9HELO|nr:uncharacterized protein Bfra_002776sb [Botrytis fragariae]KAF5876372.1 hypothetical protein Bfra_002776sb [Botrytis fragariae]